MAHTRREAADTPPRDSPCDFMNRAKRFASPRICL